MERSVKNLPTVEKLLFKTKTWQNEAKNEQMLPWIVGSDLNSLIPCTQEEKFCVMVVAEEDPVALELKDTFFNSLREPYHRKNETEIYFPELRLTLNIHALDSEECVHVSSLERIFRMEDGSLKTSVMRCWGDTSVKDMWDHQIGGECKGRSPRITDVQVACLLQLSYWNGFPSWFAVGTPGCRGMQRHMPDTGFKFIGTEPSAEVSPKIDMSLSTFKLLAAHSPW